MGSVTISASYGAQGDRIARAVAERLGLSYLDRAIPTQVARELHMSVGEATDLDERAPSRWERIVSHFVTLDPAAVNLLAPPDPVVTSSDFRLVTERVLRHVAETTGAVFLGRAAMIVLADRADVLRVRLDGPVEARIAHVVAEGTDEATARSTQKDVDGAREEYVRHFYNLSPNDPHLYHVILDSTALPSEACVDIITMAAQARFGEAAGTPTSGGG